MSWRKLKMQIQCLLKSYKRFSMGFPNTLAIQIVFFHHIFNYWTSISYIFTFRLWSLFQIVFIHSTSRSFIELFSSHQLAYVMFLKYINGEFVFRFFFHRLFLAFFPFPLVKSRIRNFWLHNSSYFHCAHIHVWLRISIFPYTLNFQFIQYGLGFCSQAFCSFCLVTNSPKHKTLRSFYPWYLLLTFE